MHPRRAQPNNQFLVPPQSPTSSALPAKAQLQGFHEEARSAIVSSAPGGGQAPPWVGSRGCCPSATNTSHNLGQVEESHTGFFLKTSFPIERGAWGQSPGIEGTSRCRGRAPAASPDCPSCSLTWTRAPLPGPQFLLCRARGLRASGPWDFPAPLGIHLRPQSPPLAAAATSQENAFKHCAFSFWKRSCRWPPQEALRQPLTFYPRRLPSSHQAAGLSQSCLSKPVPAKRKSIC